jgi:outer membrane protein OmpA-like peptidoglycan-associated protein
MRTNSLLACAAAGILLSACAGPQERVILLPQEDGTPSAIVVRAKEKEVVLDQPYTVAKVGAKRIETEQTDAAAVALRYRDVMDALPQKARSYTLYFEFGGTRLTQESHALLDRILSDMQGLPAPEMIIIGHTDDVGSESANDRLSLDRANSVLKLIQTKGIVLRDVSVVGRGEREPLVPHRKNVPEPKNRRVEIRVK